MITKEEAKIKLMKKGYTVAEDNSVLTVIIPEGESIKNTVKDVKEFFVKVGYEASFGVKQHKYAAGEEEENVNSSIAGMTDYDESENEGEDGEITDVSEEKLQKKFSDTEVEDSDDKDENSEDKEENSEDEYFDEEDEDPELSLGMEDMDMLLNENSVQFSLEDFGMM